MQELDKPDQSQRLKAVLQTEKKVQLCLHIHIKLFKHVCCHKENELLWLGPGSQASFLW